MNVLDYFDGNYEAGKGNTLSPCPPFGDVEKHLRMLSETGIEITVTYKPELRVRWSPATLTRLTRDILLKRKVKVVLIGEYSDVGHYHMHGSIKAAPRDIDRLRRRFRHELGIVEFKAIRWVESWIKYCFKEKETINPKTLRSDELIILQ